MNQEDAPGAQLLGSGTLCLTFTLPSTPVRALYERAAPRLLIDGEERAVQGWGGQRFPVTAGLHELQVWVQVESQEFGEARRAFTVEDGTETVLDYTPSFPVNAGRLGTPEELRADEEADWTRLTRAMVVLGLLVLVYLAIRVL